MGIPLSHEQQAVALFDAYCKAVIQNKARRYWARIRARRAYEELSPDVEAIADSPLLVDFEPTYTILLGDIRADFGNERLYRAVQALKTNEKAVILLKYWHGYTDKLIALYKSGHVGYYIGNGYAVEWKGFSYGCVKTKVAGRGWTHWYKLPFIQYGAATEAPVTPDQPATPDVPAQPSTDYGTRLLRYRKGHTMLKGDDVLAVQAQLIALGFDPGTADGIYGPKSAAALTAFQKARGIEVDGIVGPDTRRELSK